ncbi:heat-inducible transcriptional repressor HrcA [Tumebacillus algifaecis]|uniref:Heat-inducible transcription repressor HrcA n=1 Tax=Tumebacillus algifaecis TaxID=1214604 RepID=A0A223D402_9BACL|nr:heat-inducible transcriptional repressor HrcA [Tumebacillus algifaecis]ASS76104.1 heat-inducible transcriptional repressor HrcA [Tumebacillus algifaecis]
MLTDRQKIILQILVDDYILTAEPVGSRTISKRPDVSISPATIRNEMADLEEMGYLEQPHTSAGRIPSQKGYRFYVDHLLRPSEAPDYDPHDLRVEILQKIDQMEQVVQQSATILSSLTNYTAIVLGPKVMTTKLRQIQLVPLLDRKAVAIIVMDNGHVENRMVTIPDGVEVESITRFIELLNRKLVGVPVPELKARLHSEIANELQRYSQQFESAMLLFDQMTEVQDPEQSKVYLGGTTKILNQPEFRTVEKLKPLLDMFEQTDDLIRLIDLAHHKPGIQIRIGAENDHETFHNCSLITATYTIEGKPVGTIGVVGPTRMDYARTIAVMQGLANNLSVLLTHLYK